MTGSRETLSPFTLSGRKRPGSASETFYKTESKEVKQIYDRTSRGSTEEGLSTSGQMGYGRTVNPGLSHPKLNLETSA